MAKYDTSGGKNVNDVTVVIAAAAGLGLQTAEELARAFLSEAGYFVFTAREFMSRVRGGSNSTQIRVSTSPVRAPVERIDWLIALSPGLRHNITDHITENTRIIGDKARVGSEIESLGHEMSDAGLLRRANELGGEYYVSTISAGVVAGIFGLPEDCADKLLASRYPEGDTRDKNMRAMREGHTLGRSLTSGATTLSIPRRRIKDRINMLGNDAVAIGAASAGCNFVAAYPMSPSTDVFSWFARREEEFCCAVEQAEDEIAAINMAIGAGYAGARAMTTTSGGGFALMSEGLSLAGASETPVVVHLAQRPGPGTGLPTRTEQADLDLALYSGHGEFPRVVYAPINIESALRVTGRAFHTARKFQTPVVVLTDQYFIDCAYDALANSDFPEPGVPMIKPSESGYMRYAYPGPEETMSPFAVPGHGQGLVTLDSHEHTQSGHMTEDSDTRKRMVEKRLAKFQAMQDDALPPVVVGSKPYHTMVICWGSAFEATREALERLNCDGVVLAAPEQLSPLPGQFLEMLDSCAKMIFVEGNATGQFSRYVRSITNTTPADIILKYDSHPFTACELERRLWKTLRDICQA